MGHITKASVSGICLGIVVSFGATTISVNADAAWKPRKPVDFVIMAGKGGGADRLAPLEIFSLIDYEESI